MDKEQIREGLESGRNHPLPLLQHLHRQGDEEGVRYVADIGERYISGKERLQFRTLKHGLLPDIRKAEETERKDNLAEQREQNASTLGAAIQEKVAEKKSRSSSGMPAGGGGWNLPLDVPRK